MPRTAPTRGIRASRITSGLLALALAGGLTLATAAPAMAAPIVDQSNTGANPSLLSNPSYEFAQSFTAGVTGDLASATFSTRGVSTATAPAQLVTTSGGVPTSTVIASGTITSKTSTALTYTFTAPAEVVAGTRYALVLGYAGNIEANRNTYSRGEVFDRDSGSWVAIGASDLLFTTRVEPEVVNPVTSLVATSGDRAVTLAWTAPAAGGTPTSYSVQYRPSGTGVWLSAGSVTATSASVTGLTGGTLYDFQVIAVGTYVSSTPETTTATPYATATVPQNVTFTAGDESATVAWTAPADAGTNLITKYVVELTGPSGTVASDVTGTTTTLTGLSNGTSYSVRVFAVTADGNGAKSAVLATIPSAFAEAPVLAVTEGNETLDLEWTTPTSDGSAITQYEVEFSSSTGTTTSTTLPTVREFAATGLTNGDFYKSRVRAYNSRGAGAWSAMNTSVPRTVPGVPATFDALPGTASVQLSWTAPAFNGGATIDSYTVEYREVGAAAWTTSSATGTATGTELTGLDNGVAYEFRISAVNEAGSGAATVIESATPFAATFTFTKADGTPLAGERLPRGTEVVLTGTDLPEGAQVTFELHSAPVVLGTGVVAADGTVTIAGIIPADAAAGNHQLVGTVTSQGVTVSSSVAVVVPLLVIGGLVVTGTDVLSGLNLAALLVLIGGALLMVARRRSSSSLV